MNLLHALVSRMMKYLRDIVIIAVGGLLLLWMLGTAGILDRSQPDAIEDDEAVEEEHTQEISLYYYNPQLDQDENGNILCSRNGLVEVTRTIPLTNTPIQDAVRLLIQGDITTQERAQGVTTEFPLPSVELVGLSNNNGEVVIEFKDPLLRTSGGACRTGILWYQIERTVLQFPNIQSVRFIPEELFQP